jgi:hypothetical protein
LDSLALSANVVRPVPDQLAAARYPSFAAIPSFLPFTEKFFVAHNRLLRMSYLHVIKIIIVVGQTDHQPGGLSKIGTQLT